MARLKFDSAIFTLLDILFKRFLDDSDLDTEQAQHVTYRKFYDWAQAQMNTEAWGTGNCTVEDRVDRLFPNRDDICVAYPMLTGPDFVQVHTTMSDPFNAGAVFHTMWPMLTLAGMPPLKKPIDGLTLRVAIMFEPEEGQSRAPEHHAERTVDIAMPIYAHEQGIPFTTGQIIALWRRQLEEIVKLIRTKGIEGIYAEHVVARNEQAQSRPSNIILPGDENGSGRN
jgi:hypothetical protein